MSTLIAILFIISTIASFTIGALFGSAYRDHIVKQHEEQQQLSDEIENGREAFYKVLEKIETLELLIRK